MDKISSYCLFAQGCHIVVHGGRDARGRKGRKTLEKDLTISALSVEITYALNPYYLHTVNTQIVVTLVVEFFLIT